MSISATIHSLEEANISLAIGQGGSPETALLPPGIAAIFDPPILRISVNSTVTVNLAIFIRNAAASGTYELTVFGTQRTDKWEFSAGVPLEVTVP